MRDEIEKSNNNIIIFADKNIKSASLLNFFIDICIMYVTTSHIQKHVLYKCLILSSQTKQQQRL
jgi:hypothetical protein